MGSEKRARAWRIFRLACAYFVFGFALTSGPAQAFHDGHQHAEALFTTAMLQTPPTFSCVTQGSSSVALTWTAPASGPTAGYAVYRNGVLLATTEALSYTTSSHANPRFTVRAVNQAWESLPTAELRASSCSKG